MKKYLSILLILLNVIIIDIYSVRDYFEPRTKEKKIVGIITGYISLCKPYGFSIGGNIKW